MTETAEQITLDRGEYEALLARLEDAEDRAVIAERRNAPTLPLAAVERHLAGESLVTLWREERGLSQRALASAAGISPAMLNEIERKKKVPSIVTARALADALGVGLDDLFA
ncbi:MULTISPECIES: helix-turn-helix transcriptional regulator [unclassified Thioalkalivibrio]|uniref:helix-turn-helix transcriptional regulator n=1 Tax=unclassified Thioalkalivibrio TaxID=2621013 RepID=UPI0003820292|nr:MULTISPECIES: helix-turn-helix transcriptional regulator [unclassified Thioalkalivibrio]